MTLKYLKEFYNIYPIDNYYILHDKVELGKRIVHKYIGQIFKNKDKFYVQGFDLTNKLEVLQEQLKQYEQSLEFDLEYYYPLYRKGITEEYIVHDYLLSKGFKNIGNSFYKLIIPNVFGQENEFDISFRGLDTFKEISNEININIWLGNYSWVEIKCSRNPKEIIKQINNYLGLSGLTIISEYLKIIPEQIENTNLELKSLKTNLTVSVQDFKQELIQKLKDAITSLEK